MLEGLKAELERIPKKRYFGYVQAIQGMGVSVRGLEHCASIGSRCKIFLEKGIFIEGEVVAIRVEDILVMALSPLQGLVKGAEVELVDQTYCLYPSHAWLGRVINGQASPLDQKGPLKWGGEGYSLKKQPLPAHDRGRVKEPLDVGVRALNTFTTCCRGQRLGIFAGSGVGKSVLLSQLCKFSQAEVNVIGLIGERGREVHEFLEDYLGPEGLKKSVVVVATSDESALMRRQAAYVTVTLSEYFRAQGFETLCVIDSITRFAMALREIGLAAGEPPATKGYPPSTFAELPFLMERVGPGRKDRQEQSTGFFTVLVEGGDLDEPVSDAVRGILDGHIILSRKIAERGRFPPIDILKSLSRTMPGCNTPAHQDLIKEARRYLALYEDMADMIRLGAYRKGTDPDLDQAIYFYPLLEAYIAQSKEEMASFEKDFHRLQAILTSQEKRE